MLELLLLPFLAGVVLTGIHAWFGLHVVARGIIFVDLSLAQVAALGIAIAILAGHTVDSAAAYWYALTFAMSAALLFAIARRHAQVIGQEVVIGIVYAVCAALGVIVLDRAPQGAEHIKQILIGSILTVGTEQVVHLAMLYGAVGVVHWLLRRSLIAASFAPEHARARGASVLLWDIVFYGSFALVVTSSVRIAGVLLVFSYLIVPAAIACMLATTIRARLLLAWLLGVVVTAVGLAASWAWDLPTGPALVAAFGAATALTCVLGVLRKISLRQLGSVMAVVPALVGMLILAVPQMDHPWLDAVEAAVPQAQDFFLLPADVATRRDAAQTIAHAEKELAELRARDQDVRWGALQMPEEKQERLRQYIAARAEIVAGDQLVLRELRKQTRLRQRWLLGAPLMVLGMALLLLLHRRRIRRGRQAGPSA